MTRVEIVHLEEDDCAALDCRVTARSAADSRGLSAGLHHELDAVALEDREADAVAFADLDDCREADLLEEVARGLDAVDAGGPR